MKKSTKRLLLSLLFCIASTLCWGLACFFVNWRVYLKDTGGAESSQSVAASLIFAGMGSMISNATFLLTWPQRPFRWIKPLTAFWSFLTGVLFSFGTYQYIMSAEMNIPATIAGPISGLHILVPPLWYMGFYRRCLGVKTACGLMLSAVSVVLFSGVLSESVSYNMSKNDCVTLVLMFFTWGFGLVTQAEAGKVCTFKQFPQVNTFITIGYLAGYFTFACVVNASEITKRSTWLPFGVEKILALLPTVSMSLGTGFFSVCLLFTEDATMMVALTSTSITIPAILGIVILEEPATWNVLLGLVIALVGIIILSFELKDGTNSIDKDLPGFTKLDTVASIHEGSYRLQQVSETPLLSESA